MKELGKRSIDMEMVLALLLGLGVYEYIKKDDIKGIRDWVWLYHAFSYGRLEK